MRPPPNGCDAAAPNSLTSLARLCAHALLTVAVSETKARLLAQQSRRACTQIHSHERASGVLAPLGNLFVRPVCLLIVFGTVACGCAVEREEVERWREEFLNAALGSEPTSCIGQMLVAHKLAYDKTIDRQRKQRHELVRCAPLPNSRWWTRR